MEPHQIRREVGGQKRTSGALLYHFLPFFFQGLSLNLGCMPFQLGRRIARPCALLVSVPFRVRVRDVFRDTPLAVRMLGSRRQSSRLWSI